MKMRMKKLLSIGITILLLMSIATVVTATPWDGTPDDNTPSQAIWIDPKNTTGLGMGDTFVVDVLINITDPPTAGTGMWGWQYQLQWNTTVLDVLEVQTHGDNVPAGDLMPGHTMVLVADNTTGLANHTYVVVPMAGSAFTGVESLCTYKFEVLWQPTEPAPDYCGTLNFSTAGKFQVKVTDDKAGLLVQGTPANGTIVNGMYCVNSLAIPPEIGVPSRTPSGDVDENQPAKVSVNVTDAESGVKNVTLSYTNDTSWLDLPMTLNSTSSLYEATIPGQLAGTAVKYMIMAYDNAENLAVEDNDDEYYVYTVIPEFPVGIILPLFMIIALVAVILGKKAKSRKQRKSFVAN